MRVINESIVLPTTPDEERFWNRYRFVQTLAHIAALWAAIAVVALLAGASAFMTARAQAAWPSVTGQVTAVETDTVWLAGRFPRMVNAVRVVYEYRVGDELFSSDQVNNNAVPVEVESLEGARLLATYPAGAAVTVYYDPDDPAQSVLERAPTSGAFMAGLTMLALAAVVGLAAWFLRGWMKDRPQIDADGSAD